MTKKYLEFLRLIDVHDGLLSLTNLAMYVVLVRLAVTPEASLVDLGTLFVALAGYSAKKVINKQPKVEDSLTFDLVKKVDELTSKVTQQQMALGIREMRK